MVINMSGQTGYFLEDLSIGMSASMEKQLGEAEITQFAAITGDVNPVHMDEEYASGTMFKTRIAHGMLTASLISGILGVKLPGPGCIYLSQDVRFRAPVHIDDIVVTTATVTRINEARKQVTLACKCKVADTVVLTGNALVMVPSRIKG